jgi:PAS domain S-box-containing protein
MSDFPSAEALLSAIVNSSDDAIVSKDLNGIVTSWNRGAQKIFGYSAEEMVGQSITKIIPAERLGEEPRILESLRNGKQIDHFDTQRVRKDGKLIHVSLTISPVRNASGQIVGASKVARDITRRIQADEQLQRTTKQLEIAVANAEAQGRIKDEFLATLSHELRTPLQSVLGWLQILRSPDRTTDELNEGLEVIDRNANNQARIIEDLLDMSRILSGKVRLDVQQVPLATALEAALETIKPGAQAKEIRIEKILDPLAQPVAGDPNRLQQIFWNLLSNAVKFTPKGGKIQVLLERVNSHLEVSVADNGIGISPEFLPFVFERFRQADSSTTRNHGGLGLGLAIVKHLVELHGGSVRVKSPGASQGCTFTVLLPLAPVHDGREGRRHPSASASSSLVAAPPSLQNISVLVIDDEEDSLRLIAKMLRRSGADVHSSSSAKEAVDLIRTGSFDVLVSDIGMPNMDGYDLIKNVRSLPPEEGGGIPAIALTAYARMEDRIEAISKGFQMHLAKPAHGLELITCVKSLAEKREGSA